MKTKNKIIIVAVICIYSIILSFVIDTINSISLFQNGATHEWSLRSLNGYKCIINYIEKDTKKVLYVGFDEFDSKTCPNKPKLIEITQQEALQAIQKRMNHETDYQIILPGSIF